MVKSILLDNFSLSDIYADWLPKHLEHLTAGSRTILMNLKDKDFDLVRYSTVVSLSTGKEHNQFEANIRVLIENGDRKRKHVLDSGIAATQLIGKNLSLKDFMSVVRMVLR